VLLLELIVAVELELSELLVELPEVLEVSEVLELPEVLELSELLELLELSVVPVLDEPVEEVVLPDCIARALKASKVLLVP